MSRRRRKRNRRTRRIRPEAAEPPSVQPAGPQPDAIAKLYLAAFDEALAGNLVEAELLYVRIGDGPNSGLLALVENDLGALAALRGRLDEASAHFQKAMQLDGDCATARCNLQVVEQHSAGGDGAIGAGQARDAPPRDGIFASARPVRVAIVSLLFNWPSTGGGTVHTAELGKFLGRAGYAVRHIYAQYADWGIGKVTAETGVASVPLAFEGASWNAAEIKRRFRQAVDEFTPDYVIITDSWNFKPLLAEAVRGYRYFLRLAALECLCPLNNVRLLVDDRGRAAACPRHQLASPHLCSDCVARRQHQSGSLHQAERALSGYGTPEYDQKLRQAFAEAEGVLVVNPLIAAMVGPFARAVHVVPSGFDPGRFPWPAGEKKAVAEVAAHASASSACDPPWPPLMKGGKDLCEHEKNLHEQARAHSPPSQGGARGGGVATSGDGPFVVPPSGGVLEDRHRSQGPAEAGTTNSRATRAIIFFAGLVNEYMKGFHVLHAACAKLWQKRRDFELVATADPPGQLDPMTRFVGWLSQEELPRQIRQADFLVFPTIAEEALGRSAVEAMGVGRPVIASRIGGLPFTVADGATGLLFEPGNVDDLGEKIERLLDDLALRDRMGRAGRQRFEECFTWEAIIEKHYRHLLVVPPSGGVVGQISQSARTAQQG
jgi:glycosyltransferase involved in cell wall biosynthesis